MKSFSGHLGRAIPIQLAMERHPCLDELHESRKIQALIKIGPEKDRDGRYAGNSLEGLRAIRTKKVTRKTRSPDISGKMQPGHYNRNVAAALILECYRFGFTLFQSATAGMMPREMISSRILQRCA